VIANGHEKIAILAKTLAKGLRGAPPDTSMKANRTGKAWT